MFTSYFIITIGGFGVKTLYQGFLQNCYGWCKCFVSVRDYHYISKYTGIGGKKLYEDGQQ